MSLSIDKNKFWKIMMFLLLCGITAMAVYNIAVPKTVCLLLFFCSQVIMSWEYRVASLFMLVPFASILPMDEMVMIFIAVQVWREKKTKVRVSSFIILILFFIIEAIAEVRHGAEIKSAIVFAVYILAATMICFHSANDSESETMVSAFLIGLTFAILATMMISVQERSLVGMISTRLGMLPVNSAYKFTIGANGMGLMCAISIAIQAHRLLSFKDGAPINLALLLWYTIAGLLTQSRGFLIGLAFITIAFLFFMHRQHKLTTTHMVSIIAIVILLVFVYFKFFGDSVASLMDRFERDADDITNGRIDINGYYIDHFFDDVLSSMFGYGLIAYKDFLGGESIHNALIEMLLAWGIVGFCISVGWIVMLVKHKLSRKGLVLTSVVPVCVVLLMVQSTRLFRTRVPIMYFTVALMSIRYALIERMKEQDREP